jgi:RNA polymerase sigma-70 factor (ECF subfamily)
VHLYGPLVLSWCRRRGLQTADAEDVTQEVLRTVFTRIGEFRKGPGGSFRGWLLGITRNKLGDHWRRCSRQPQAEGGSEVRGKLEQVPSEEPADEPASAEAMALYRRAFNLIRSEFEEQTWQAFWLVVCENRPPADVARELSLSLNAVYLAKSRVLRRLRETLGDLPEEEPAAEDGHASLERRNETPTLQTDE